MPTRRELIRGLIAVGATAAFTREAAAFDFTAPSGRRDFFMGGNSGGTSVDREPVQPNYTAPRATKPMIPSKIVPYNGTASAGSILISAATFKLYYIESSSTATEYPISVGREGMEIPGSYYPITAKRPNPVWRPTERMRNEDPSLPAVVSAGPHNPLGTRALNLGDTLYRIHGTNEPDEIGGAVSSGCIRMYNQHVEELFDKVNMGAGVYIYNGPVPGVHYTANRNEPNQARFG